MPKEALDTPLEIIREKKLMFYGTLKNKSLNRVQWILPEKNTGGWKHGISRCIEQIVCACRIYRSNQGKMWNLQRV